MHFIAFTNRHNSLLNLHSLHYYYSIIIFFTVSEWPVSHDSIYSHMLTNSHGVCNSEPHPFNKNRICQKVMWRLSSRVKTKDFCSHPSNGTEEYREGRSSRGQT